MVSHPVKKYAEKNRIADFIGGITNNIKLGLV